VFRFVLCCVASRDVFLRDALAKFLLTYTDYRETSPLLSIVSTCFAIVQFLLL
jgi:hypothetical protein